MFVQLDIAPSCLTLLLRREWFLEKAWPVLWRHGIVVVGADETKQTCMRE
jgi:hypothetical protein